jgi:trafficking kinesin-binding protein 2
LKKPLTPRSIGKAKSLKVVFKNQTLVYLNSGSNLLGRLRRNQRLSVLMGSFGAPVCTSSPKMGILKEDWSSALTELLQKLTHEGWSCTDTKDLV